MNTLTLTFLALTLGSPHSAGLFLSDVAPPVGGVDIQGQEQNLTFDSKPMLVAFFSSWDAGSDNLLLRLQEFSTAYGAKGVRVVAVAKEQNADGLPKPGPKTAGIILMADPFGVLANRYMVTTTPTVFLVNPANRIAFKGGPATLVQADEALGKMLGIPKAGIENMQAAVTTSRKAYRFARAPAAKDAANRWRALALHLGQSSGTDVSMFQEAGYPEFQDGIRAGAYDIFNAGPTLCYLGREKYEPLAVVERAGKRSYTGIAFVPRASKIKSIEDLRGKTVGLVSPHSTSGGIYPRKMMLDAGLKPSRDVRIKWFGSHEKVAQAVKRRWVHAGACFDDCRNFAWSRAQEETRATRILAYTPPIPGEMIMVRKDLPAETKAALKRALIVASARVGLLQKISENELPISNIVEARLSDLNVIGPVLEQVEKESRD